MVLRFAVGVLGLMLVLNTASAEKADRTKPVNIQADSCQVDQQSQTSVCHGNVIVTQGTMEMHSEHMTVRQDAEGNQYAQAEGRPVKYKEKMDNSPDWAEAEALRADYNGKTGLLKLMDKAMVKRGQDVTTGNVLTYNLNTGVFNAEAGGATPDKAGGRVHITLNPRKKESPEK